MGESGRHGWSTTLKPVPCLTHEAGCQLPLTRRANTFHLSACLGFYGEAPWKMVATTTTGSAVSSLSGRELGSPGASGALHPPLAEALPAPVDVVPEDVPLRPVLSAWSLVAALQTGSRPSMEAALQQLRERQWIEARKNELSHGARPHEAEILDAPSKPEDPMEIERREVAHMPPMPWCLACRFGNVRDASRLIIAVQQCDQQLRSRSTSVSSVKMQRPMTWRPIMCWRILGRRFSVQWTWRHRPPWRLRCGERTLSSSTRLRSSLGSSRGSGTRNWSQGAKRTSHHGNCVQTSWQRSRRQVCKLEFDQRRHLATARSPWVQWVACRRCCRNKYELFETDLETKIMSHLLTSHGF